MNYFLKDINEIYPLSDYIEFPSMSDYLTTEFAEMVTESGYYDESKICAKILRKYQYNEIGTSDVSQFYDYLNQLIEENFSEYLMTLVTISETYSVQNIDTRNETFTHTITSGSNNLVISNDTPSNKLNIDNIKAGTSASNVEYTTTKDTEYTDTKDISSTSALNTTQFNVKSQLEINDLVQKALNKFVDSLIPAFSLVESEYYG